MRRPDIGKRVHEYIFPVKRAGDPDSWASFIHPNGIIVKEVREERLRFYGPPPNPRVVSHGYPLEAMYPGLDYNNPWHRMRLSFFRWHKILFRALDALQLSSDEIDSIMTFEGTKCARQQYERERGVIIKDTTGDELLPFSEPFLALRKSSALVSNPVRVADSDSDSGSTEAASLMDSDQEEDPPDRVDEEMEVELSGGESPNYAGDEDEIYDMDSADGEDVRPGRPPVNLVGIGPFEQHMAETYPNGPPPPRQRTEVIAEGIEPGITGNTTIRLNAYFTEAECEEWQKHAGEQGYSYSLERGSRQWEVPCRLVRAFMEAQTNAIALATVNHPNFYDSVNPLDRRAYVVVHMVDEPDDSLESEESDTIFFEVENAVHHEPILVDQAELDKSEENDTGQEELAYSTLDTLVLISEDARDDGCDDPTDDELQPQEKMP